MADYNKTIEIEMKADLKQLLQQFKKMPGMTAKEARKMVSQLSKELKQAQKAAEKTAKATSKSMQKIEVSAKKAGRSVSGMRRQTRELGRSLSSMSEVVGDVNPELGAFAAQAEVAAHGFRGFSSMLATGNPLIIAVVASIAAGAGAYALWNHSANESKASQEELEKVLKETNAELKKQEERADAAADSLLGHASAANTAAIEYQLMTGALSDFEYQQLQVEKKSGDLKDQMLADAEDQDTAILQQIVTLKKQQKQWDKRFETLKNQEKLITKTSKGAFIVTENTKEYNEVLKNQAEIQKKLTDKEEELKASRKASLALAEAAAKRFEENEKKKLKFRKEAEAEEEARKARSKAENERLKKNAKLLKEIAKEKQRMEKIDDEISASREQALESNFSLEIGNRQRTIAMMDNEKDKLEAQLQLEKDLITKKEEAIKSEISRIKALAESDEQRIKANETIAEQEKGLNALQKERNILEDEFAEKKEALTKKLVAQNVAEANSIASMVVSLAKATSQLIGNLTEKDKESAMMQFRISQGIAIAEIAMTTATNIAKMFPNPIMMGAAGALGAVQAGVVLSTPPPEFHMGGMINKGPDTQLITALKGEGIVDRSTMREIGGEEGLRRIKQGTMNNQEVIVRTPFKHFDNYSKVSIKRNGALSRLQRTRSIGVY